MTEIARLSSTCTIFEPFETSLQMLRDALRAGGVAILGEFDVTSGQDRDSILPRSRVLYLDSPFLLLEALALDRAVAVSPPPHVMIREQGDWTRLDWMDPAAVSGTQSPGGVSVPIYNFQTRLTRALAWLN